MGRADKNVQVNSTSKKYGNRKNYLKLKRIALTAQMKWKRGMALA